MLIADPELVQCGTGRLGTGRCDGLALLLRLFGINE
jgi:hypothetical protein